MVQERSFPTGSFPALIYMLANYVINRCTLINLFIHHLYPLVPELRVTGVCWSLSQPSLGEGTHNTVRVFFSTNNSNLDQIDIYKRFLPPVS